MYSGAILHEPLNISQKQKIPDLIEKLNKVNILISVKLTYCSNAF